MRILIFLLCIGLGGAALADASLEQAISLYESGSLDEAQSQLEEIRRGNPDLAEAHYYLGLIRQSRGEFMAAADDFEQAVELDGEQSRYHQGLGEAYGSAAQDVSFLKQMRLAGKIRKAFERAVELDPDNIDARAGLVTYYVNAPGVAGGSEEKAMDQAAEIAKRDTFRGHMARAAIYQSRDDDAAVEREYRAAMADSPENTVAHQALGVFLTARERFDEAMQTYDAGLGIDPDDMGIIYQVGRTASISGKFLERGAAAFTRYLEYTPGPEEPGLDWANYRLGLIHRHQGSKDAAQRHFEQALELNPKHSEARKALKKLR